MPHAHRWSYFYVPGDGYRYCACGVAETVAPDGKTGPVPAKSEAFVRRKIDELEKKAYAVPGSLNARVRALVEKRAALPTQLTHALVGAPIGAALGAGVQYARNYDNPDADARLRAVGKGAFGGGVLGALGGALHGQLQHEGATHAANQASVAARDHAAGVLERRQQALDAVGARPHADYRRGQLEVNTAGDYHVDAVRKMSDGEFNTFLREMGQKISPEDVRLRDLRAARARIGTQLDTTEAQVQALKNRFDMTQEEFDAMLLDPTRALVF